ncbi:frizzled-8-like, partial [Limulus polyphemus]|uniref:Frizzled-8-like n=1 Tax=Limulus polyphemus TaxID=6850 RepID=A0ABM1TPM1_LIMPO
MFHFKKKSFKFPSVGSSSKFQATTPKGVSRFLGLVFLAANVACTSDRNLKCEEITIPMCRNIGYNYTSMPNQFYHDTQEEAGMEVQQFWPLVEIQCSDDLRFLLCSMYTPICMEDYHSSLPACRSVCERSRAGCAPIMRQYGFAWPERMNCEGLPNYGDPKNLCMDEKEGSGSTKPKSSFILPEIKLPTGMKAQIPGHGKWPEDVPDVPIQSKPNPNSPSLPETGTSDCGCSCRSPMVPLLESNERNYYNKVETGSVLNCAVPCHGAFFSTDEHTFATLWLGLWAVLCCVSTSLTVITFLIDMQRFRYPERPIIFLS